MIHTLFQTHPLLAQLPLPANPCHFLYGLHEARLIRSHHHESSLIVGEHELRTVFSSLCEQGSTDLLQKLFSYDFQTFIQLPDSHPFHLKRHPFNDLAFVLESVEEANRANKQETSLYLQRGLHEWVHHQLASRTSIFADDTAKALNAVALYQPALAYQRLRAFKHAPDDVTKPQYQTVLSAFSYLAMNPVYFKFATSHLFSFAALEAKLGHFQGSYGAFYHLTSFFCNSGARASVPLNDRKNILIEWAHQANESHDYYSLYILLKLLGVAADIFESGEYSYQDDLEPNFDDYIHSAIELLMQFAGTDDEFGLSSTAEQQLHNLLQSTCDEPNLWGASDVPFIIFRFFLELKREWNMNPFAHLNQLSDHIRDLKLETDIEEDHMSRLEIRLEQFISMIADREFISKDFTLYLSSKHPERMCEIGNAIEPETRLELHERQSLTERLIFSGTTDPHSIQRSYPKCTYVIASLGFVISSKAHEPIGDHTRVFKTIPIKVPHYTISGRAHQYGGHAEEAFYSYMLDDDTIRYYLDQFKAEHQLNESPYKIYSVVLDLHGTYDMCLSCSHHGLRFQEQFREKLRQLLPEAHLLTLRKYPSQLPIIIRYSSDLKYHYYGNQQDNKQGVLTVTQNKGSKRELRDKMTTGFDLSRDVKQFGANLLIHGQHNWHQLWSYKKSIDDSEDKIKLESWTGFTSDYQFNRCLSEDDRKRPYQ